MAPESGLATPKLQRRSTSRQFRVSTFKGPEGKELEAVAAPTRQQDHAVSLTRLRQKASLIGTLFRVAGESIAPLEGYFQDSTKNCQVYSKIWEKPQEPEGSPEKSKSEQKEAELSTPKTQQTVEIVNGSPAPTEREDETPEQKSAASGRLPDHQAQQSKEEDAGGPETFVSSSSSFLSSVLPGGRDSGAAADSTDAPAAHVAMDCSGASEPDANVQEGSGQGPSVSASARVPPDADNITSLKNNFGEPGYCLCQLNLRSEYDTPRKCSRKSSPSALRCTQHLNSKTAMSFCNEMHLDWSCVRADLQNGAFRVEFHCDTPSSRRHPDAEGAKDKRPPARNFSVAAFGNGALKAVADYVAGKSYEVAQRVCCSSWRRISLTTSRSMRASASFGTSVRQESELLDKENVPGAGRTLEGKDQDLDGMCCQPVSGSGEFLKENAVKKRRVLRLFRGRLDFFVSHGPAVLRYQAERGLAGLRDQVSTSAGIPQDPQRARRRHRLHGRIAGGSHQAGSHQIRLRGQDVKRGGGCVAVCYALAVWSRAATSFGGLRKLAL
ncbi:hypothetical protein AK812_SmicGene25950 [Symbiodinium microadriaticum]|uniref:Uncharacterized protein n=1 Tax=Symbiodinium microadriaticum TaxID=2951 RepID=A0A1Q9DAT9_SYMMI|nr:hypothetical protein AK812_SmicGene25950 [Symbiodinium microadriaticum]